VAHAAANEEGTARRIGLVPELARMVAIRRAGALNASEFLEGGFVMADYYITVYLDEEGKKLIEGAGLGSHIKDIGGKAGVQVEMDKKDQKKLIKGYPGLEFDASNACTLPKEAEGILLNFIKDMKTLDVMKVAIMKLYNPLAGKDLRTKL